jgi:hypothetical protein
MRKGALATAIAIAVVASATAAASGGSQCGPAGAKTLASDSQARVYSSNGSVYGCADATGHRYLLASDETRPGQPHIGKVALAGVDVAYGETTFSVDTGSATVTVRQLDNGRRLKSLAALTVPVGPESFESVDSVVVKPDGAVAWIATAASIVHHENQTQVLRADRRGEASLDTGTGIETSSLRLRRSRLSWRDGSGAQSATLI